MSERMMAMVLTGHGGPEKLVWREIDRPEPGPSQVLIKVAACGLNNTDINTRVGWYSKDVTDATDSKGSEGADDDAAWGGSGLTFPHIQGADVCGHVVAAGADADHSLIGKRVITDNWLRDWDDPLNKYKTGYLGSEAWGGFAGFCAIDHRNVAAIESSLTDAELATFSCSYSTAEGMLDRAKVTGDDVVLITGASGGVGSALVQLAKRRGATIVALAGEAKHAQVAELGPDAILPRAPADLPAALASAIGRDTVDVVADIVGGPYFPTLIEALARGGRYTCSGAIAGPIVDLDLRTLYLSDLTFTGSTVNEPHVFPNLVTYIEAGEVRPILAKTFPLKDLRSAQEAFVSKAHVGNIVVIP